MAKAKDISQRKKLKKLTNQGGSKPKTSAMNKGQKRSFKLYRGQGK